MTLETLTNEACLRVLSEDELQELNCLAELNGNTQKVLVKLLTSGTSAGRANLAASKTLTSKHSPRQHDRKEFNQIKMTEIADRIQAGRSANLPFAITDHAFERYAERHLSTEPLEAAMVFLKAEAITATPIRDRTFTGDEQWVSQSGVLFVVRRDGGGSLPVCITVLPREEDKVVGHQIREGKPRPSRWR